MSGSFSPPPNDAPIGVGHAAWTQLVDAAGRERLRRADTAAGALATGELDLRALCRYAAGAVDEGQRRHLEAVLARSPWAVRRVAALVRAARGAEQGGLARRLLEAARVEAVDPRRLSALALLEALGRTDAQEVVTGGEASDLERLPASSPLLRAACLLGLGQADAARDLFAELEGEAGADPLAGLCRRVADCGDDDDALAELLDFLAEV